MLRARTPDGVDQEIHALLIVYQLLLTAMVDATDSQPDIDPDQASFTTALTTARDQVVHAAGVIADTDIDLVGVIGSHVLNNLLPERRVRVKARMIKRSKASTRPAAQTSTGAATKPPPASTYQRSPLTTTTRA
ncbi:hypothetical protein ACVCAH_27640 [Micromonospora sp. LZ34]